MHKATAKRWYSQIVESAEPKPEQPRCKIMRRLGPMDDTPLGCYVPVAWCEDYGMFEELLKGAKIEHGLICVQEQAEEASEPAKEPEPDEGPFVLLLIFACAVLTPLYVVLVTSFKGGADVSAATAWVPFDLRKTAQSVPPIQRASDAMMSGSSLSSICVMQAMTFLSRRDRFSARSA